MNKHLLLIMVPLLALGGCTTTGSQKMSFAPVAASPKAATAVETALLAPLSGGLIQQDATSRLATRDLRNALEAEYRALEYGASGEAIAWKAAYGGTSGNVVANQPYRVGSQDCRQYTQSVTSAGQLREFRGAACRNGNGSWSLLN